MIRSLSAAVALAAMVTLAPSPASAGPWSPGKQNAYRQVGFGYTRATDRQEFLLNLYGEFGLGHGLAAIAALPIKGVDQQRPPPSGNDTGSFFAISPTVGLRWQYLQLDRFVMALQIDLKLPLTGGSFDGTLWLLGGTTFPFLDGFFQFGGALRGRTGRDASEWLTTGDIGFWVADSALLVFEGRTRIQFDASRNAQLAEREFQVGMQWIWRPKETIDVGLDALFTFPTNSIARGITIIPYVAFRR